MALTRTNTRPSQRQIDLTTAVCQERLLATHVRHVLAMVDLVADELPFDSAVDIYVRVLRLTPEQARNVGSRALASLGQRGINPSAPSPIHGDGDEEVVETSNSRGASSRSEETFARFRRRIRGRVQEDLRHRINLAAARAEDAIVEAHVQNALTFVRTFAGEVGESEAAELYLETMAIGEGVADVVYNRTLRLIADDTLPRVEGEPVSATAGAHAT